MGMSEPETLGSLSRHSITWSSQALSDSARAATGIIALLSFIVFLGISVGYSSVSGSS